MKINNLLGKFGAFIAVTAALSGCLKDSDYDNGVIQSIRTTGDLIKPIELKISATNNTNFATVSVNSTPNDTTSDFLPVVLATADPAPEDIHVTVEMVDSLVDNLYNAGQAADRWNFRLCCSRRINVLYSINGGCNSKRV